jgi:hypothetical protein
MIISLLLFSFIVRIYIANGFLDSRFVMNHASSLHLGSFRLWGIKTTDDSFLDILRAYKNENGDLLVKFSFVVPEDNEHYPREAWGLPLGRRVYDLRRGKIAANNIEFRHKLDDLGFEWYPASDKSEARFDKFCRALNFYKMMYGMRVIHYYINILSIRY